MENKENIEERINELNVELKDIENKTNEKVKDIVNNYLNKEIEHKSLGKGLVIDSENNIIQVKFKNDVVKKFKIPDAFINKFLIANKANQEMIDRLEKLNEEKGNIQEEIESNSKILDEIINGKKININNTTCKEAKICIEQGYISVDDDIEFKTIRDVSDLFNKNYKGLQKSWIKVDSDWQRVASCYQMTSESDRNIYRNILTADGKYFYYLINEENDSKKEDAVNGIINHEMKITYLFLKYPESSGYKFVGVFEKDIDAMKKSIEDKEYKVVYKKISDRLELKQFFR